MSHQTKPNADRNTGKGWVTEEIPPWESDPESGTFDTDMVVYFWSINYRRETVGTAKAVQDLSSRVFADNWHPNFRRLEGTSARTLHSPASYGSFRKLGVPFWGPYNKDPTIYNKDPTVEELGKAGLA